MQSICETEKFNIEISAVQRMPGQFLVSHCYLFTVFGKNGKLVREIKSIKGIPQVAVRKNGIATVWLALLVQAASSAG